MRIRTFAFLACLLLAANAQLKHSSVIRTLDLTSQLVRETVSISVINDGTTAESTYSILSPNPENLAFIEVKEKNAKTSLLLSAGNLPGEWQLTFPSPLPPKEKFQLVLSLVYTHQIHALPAEIAQLEPQFVKYNGLLHFYSPYVNTKEKTVVILPSGSRVISKSTTNLSEDGNKLTYGIFNDVSPKDTTVLDIHYENNSPFITVEKLQRTLEVSHWGNNLAVDEAFTIVHSGAKLRGSFSRLEQMKAMGHLDKTALVENFEVLLPKDATDVYYWDIIGNISTSNFRYENNRSRLQLQSRYPMFGGWRNQFAFGYNQPLSSALFNHGSGYALQVPLATLFENSVVDEFSLKVILPEGASNIKIVSDVNFDVIEMETLFTYLDSYGRPVLVASKQNIVNEHVNDIYVVYNLPPSALLNEPFLLFVFFLGLFSIAMIYVRIDLTIAKDSQAETREKVYSISLDVQRVMDDLSHAYKTFAFELSKFTESRQNVDSFKQAFIKLEAEHKRLEDELKKLQEKLSSLHKARADQIGQLKGLVQEKLNKNKRIHSEILGVKANSKDVTNKNIEELNKDLKQVDAKIKDLLVNFN